MLGSFSFSFGLPEILIGLAVLGIVLFVGVKLANWIGGSCGIGRGAIGVTPPCAPAPAHVMSGS